MRARDLRELEKAAMDLEEDLSRTEILLRHVDCYETRPDAVADCVRRTEELEET
jgi:hypothetical protein